MAKAFFLLICYHLLLFRKFYFLNPYVYARSEALEQGFASSWLLGQQLRRTGILSPTVDEPFYYPDHAALPFLSTYYWPHRLQAWMGSWLSLNQAWILYSLTMVLHFLLCSVSVYILATAMGSAPIVAGLMSVTLSTLGYALKQNSCISYTLAWVPCLMLSACTHSVAWFGISLGMMLTAGYWPIALYAGGLGCCYLLLG